MIPGRDGYKFESTGRQIWCNLAIVGINPGLEISEGYDGGLDHEGLIKVEKVELANYMIGLWQKFKESV